MAILLRLNEAFTDTTLPTLDGLAGWGGGDSGGDAGGGTELPLTDEYGTMSYRLKNGPLKLTGYNKLDTGVKLFETVDASWTVVCVIDGEISCPQGYPYNVLSCMLDGGKGLAVRRGAGDEGLTVLAGSSGIRFDLAGPTEKKDGRNVMVLTKGGDLYGLYLNGDIAYGAPLSYGITEADAHDCSLIVGARRSPAGAYEYYTSFTLVELRVYTEALSAAAAAAISAELA